VLRSALESICSRRLKRAVPRAGRLAIDAVGCGAARAEHANVHRRLPVRAPVAPQRAVPPPQRTDAPPRCVQGDAAAEEALRGAGFAAHGDWGACIEVRGGALELASCSVLSHVGAGVLVRDHAGAGARVDAAGCSFSRCRGPGLAAVGAGSAARLRGCTLEGNADAVARPPPFALRKTTVRALPPPLGAAHSLCAQPDARGAAAGAAGA
jgi:hypothetical protein